MATAWPFPCRIQDTGTGDFYYFDGINPGTLLTGGAGTDLNNVLGNAGNFTATTTQRQNLQNYFMARLVVFAQLAACESCPGLGKTAEGHAHDLDAMMADASERTGVE